MCHLKLWHDKIRFTFIIFHKLLIAQKTREHKHTDSSGVASLFYVQSMALAHCWSVLVVPALCDLQLKVQIKTCSLSKISNYVQQQVFSETNNVIHKVHFWLWISSHLVFDFDGGRKLNAYMFLWNKSDSSHQTLWENHTVSFSCPCAELAFHLRCFLSWSRGKAAWTDSLCCCCWPACHRIKLSYRRYHSCLSPSWALWVAGVLAGVRGPSAGPWSTERRPGAYGCR